MLHQYSKEKFPLLLRPLSEDDIEQMRIWRNLDHIRRNFIFSETISLDQQKKWFDKHKVVENDFVFIIEETSTLCKKIGTVSIYNYTKDLKEAEFGRFFIGEEDAQGKGYGVLAAKLASFIAFEQMGIKKLFLEVFVDNLTAYSIYKKVGFHEYNERMANGRKLICMALEK
jgi:RimJ/RimL family protein N-acetyltransferase